MKFWPWRRPEVRSANYTDQAVSRLLAAASAKGDGGALGAIETAARWWGAGLASARVTPSSSALDSVTPGVLDTVGRALCRAGESLHVIDVRDGRVALTPCGRWTVHGSDDERTWIYRCDLSGPDATRTVTLPAASVVHVRYAAPASQPWKGRSPVQLAIDTARAAGLLETATAGELNFTQQQVLTPRHGAGDYMTDTLTPDMMDKIVSAVAEHVGTGAFVIPADVTPQRLGPEPPDSVRSSFVIVSKTQFMPVCTVYRPRWSRHAAPVRPCAKRIRQVLHGLVRPLGAARRRRTPIQARPGRRARASTL